MSQNLATSAYTLASFKAVVRTQSNSISQQESQLIDLQMNDIIHNSIMLVRTMLGRALDAFYNTEQLLGSIALTNGYGTITIATYSISEINKCRLFDPTLKEIPIVSNLKFNALRSLYTNTMIGAVDGFATIAAQAATPNVLKVELFTGATGPITTLDFYYPRNPVKVTADTDTVDLPDHLVPIAQDMATVSVYRKLSKTPPVDADARVTSFIQGQMSQLGFEISPQDLQK